LKRPEESSFRARHEQNGMSLDYKTRRLGSMTRVTRIVSRFLRDDTGQDLVEYALLLVFLALAAIAVLPTLGKAVNNVFSESASSLTAGS
jgi:Flp pilus assembly pilin Flp